MKLRIRDRILSALMGLIIVLMTTGVLLHAFGYLLPGQQLTEALQTLHGWQLWAFMALCAVLLVIGLCGIGLLFRRRKDKGVVVQHTEYGDMSISMKAMENMVKKCVDAHPELNVNHTKISHSRGGIDVDIKITLMGGVNIPLTVNALQKQIKQYITSCSGVDVEEVRVMVETDSAKLLTAPVEEPRLIPVVEEPEAKPAERATECLCQHKEEPQTYADAPIEQPVEEEKIEEAPAGVEEEIAAAEEPAAEAETEEIAAEAEIVDAVDTEATSEEAQA